MAAFSNELIDLVIDQLRDDKPSLSSCSLVSRQWVPRSRFYHFSSAKFIIDTVVMRGGMQGVIQFAPGAVRLNAFLDILSSPLATFIGSLRELTLYHTLDGPRYTSMNILCPMDILCRLEARGLRLCKLGLSFNAFFAIPHEGSPPFASSLVALDIDLLNADGNNLRFVFSFICAYPKLEQLNFVDGFGQYEVGTLMELQLPTSLRSLTTGYLPLVKWIVALQVPPTHIETLELLYAVKNWLPWLNALLSGPIAHNLRTLAFTDLEVDANYPLDLSNFYNLRHLRVVSEVHERLPETLVYLLSHLHRSPARKTIDTLTMGPITWHDADAYSVPDHWRALDNMLSAEDWPALRRVNIRGAVLPVHRRVGEDSIVDKFSVAFHHQLPECVRRGLLEVDLWDEEDRDTEN